MAPSASPSAVPSRPPGRTHRSPAATPLPLLLIVLPAILVSMAQQTHANESRCNYVTLVKCFINILDEWTWTLYELKDNVVTINQDQCDHLRQLDRCIQDDGPEAHECNHAEIVAASNTVSDLLTHRKNSGSFLKSYYLLTYACSPEGQQLLGEHRNCLNRERIGEMTISAGTYLSEKFLEHPDEEVCTEVNNKLKEYMDAMGELCEEEAKHIMCKSLVGMFKGLHADKVQLSACEFSCPRKRENASGVQRDQGHGEYEEGDGEQEEDGDEEVSRGEPEGLAGDAPRAGAATLLTLAAMLGGALLLQRGL